MSRSTQRDPRARRRPSTVDSDSDSQDDVVRPCKCFIPADNIDLVVLATYFKEFIDDTATVEPSANGGRQGYIITSRHVPASENLRDIILDCKTWEKEKSSRNYRSDPYPYSESNTWYERQKNGASRTHPFSRRRRKEPKADPQQSKHVRVDDRKGEKGADRDGRRGKRHDGDEDETPPERDWETVAAKKDDQQYRLTRNHGDSDQEESRPTRPALQNPLSRSANPRTLPRVADTTAPSISSKTSERHAADGEARHASGSNPLLDSQDHRGSRESDRHARGDASRHSNDVERLPDRRRPIARVDASGQRNNVERLPDRRRPIRTE